MRIKTNALRSVRDFFDKELKLFYSSEEVRFYFYWCCEHFLNMTKIQVIANLDFRISESMMLKFNFVVKDLKKHKPIQYILETCDFSGLTLHITPNALIPRPETEELVQKISKENLHFEGQVLDICTGSGCMALALKKQFLKASVQGLDISKKAIALAKRNAKKNRLNVDFFVADIFVYNPNQYFDLIVGNPPYVLYSEKSLMQINVLNYEPHRALFVDDENPLIFYTAIIDFADQHLNSGGRIYLEINEKFGNEVKEMLKNKGFSEVVVCKDFRAKERFVQGIKSNL